METILEAINLKKEYNRHLVLDIENLKIQKGKIVGLIGPNGSGKTIFMRIAAGMLEQSHGSITICGLEPGIATKSMVSFLPETPYLSKWLTIEDSVGFFKDFYADMDDKKALEILQIMKINKKDYVSTLSKGSFDKVALALTLSRKSKLYLLDEPFSGVDRIILREIIDLTMNTLHDDCSIIISTQRISETERVFDDVIFLGNGKIVLSDNAEDLRQKEGKSVDGVFKEVFSC